MNQISDISLNGEDFRSLAALAYSESGLQLVAEKRSMIQSRLRRRLKVLGLSDFAAYTKFVCSNHGVDERRHMISALTTNVSHFFREKHHFEILSKALKERHADSLRANGRLRIWSAGCSNGQEAVSTAVTILATWPEAGNWDVKILATDIDPKVVEFASKGIYPERYMDGVPLQLRTKFFTECINLGETFYEIDPEVRSMITFKELNLLSTWPMRMPMDFIFCRNVVIYFDLATQNALWPRFHAQLKSDGYLFLGHSERIVNPESAGFASCGPTTYRPLHATPGL